MYRYRPPAMNTVTIFCPIYSQQLSNCESFWIMLIFVLVLIIDQIVLKIVFAKCLQKLKSKTRFRIGIKRFSSRNSFLFHCRVTTFGKLFTHVPLLPSSIIWYRLHRWDVNRHTARYTGPVSVVSQRKNWCLAEGLRKRRSEPPYGP